MTDNQLTELHGISGKQAPAHLYRIVVRTLQAEIVAGIFPVGTQLPSEAALCDRFQVSRHTIREALRFLRGMRLVESRQGAATTVSSRVCPQSYVHRVSKISDLFDVNVETRYSETAGQLVALPSAASPLEEFWGQKTWICIHGHRYNPMEEQPMCEFDAYVHSRFAGVARALPSHNGPIYGLIEIIYGESIGEVRQDIGGFRADGVSLLDIGLEKGDPGIEIRRIYRLSPSREIGMVSFNRYPADGFKFSMTMLQQ